MIELYILFAIIIIINAFMDSLNFHRKHDNGFWSLHTKGKRIDAWHTAKIIMLGLVAYGFVGFNLKVLCILAIINLVLHQLFLHFIFKPKEK